jgi:hypothetical protein
MTPPDLAVVEDLSLVPGAMERKLRRVIPGGLIEYLEAEAGWLTQAGTVRVRPYRTYLWTPDGEQPIKLPSVSHICDQVCPKDGVPHWSEARGIEGALTAFKAGWLTVTSRALDAIAIVREHGLGAEAAKSRAAKRGLNVHAINDHYMKTGEPPKQSDHPAEHRGFIQSWSKAILALRPIPIAVEQLVVHPEDGYAGRLDMRASVRGALELDEFKTQEWGGLFSSTHLQAMLYERAAVRCGAEPASRLRAIVLPADGNWNEDQHSIIVDSEDSKVEAALAWFREKRAIDSACRARNRAVRT